MVNLFHKLASDEAGFIVSAELILVATIAVLALIVGLSEVAMAVPVRAAGSMTRRTSATANTTLSACTPVAARKARTVTVTATRPTGISNDSLLRTHPNDHRRPLRNTPDYNGRGCLRARTDNTSTKRKRVSEWDELCGTH
jgi:hypothetical protein